MTEDIYKTYKIDSNELIRNYIKYPLKLIKGSSTPEKPYKEDLEYLYLKCNLTRDELSQVFDCGKTTLSRWLKDYHIKKDDLLTKEKRCKTNIKKYGCEYPFQSKVIQEKTILSDLLNHNGMRHQKTKKSKEAIEKTNLKKYGCKNVFQNKRIIEKIKKTLNKKYGCEYISQSDYWKKVYTNKKDIIQKKMYDSKKKNNTLGKSKEEIEVYNLIKQKYPNTTHHYKSALYPFVCDFYIPEIDTYIEYNGYWTHGFEPYVGTDKQKEKVKLWESKNNSQYNKAINDWTIRDPLKRKTAKDNGLNWIEFFNKKDVILWLNE